MQNLNSIAVERLQQAVPAAEAQIDGALIAVSSLMAEVVTARRDTAGVPAAKGHATIRRIAEAQLALVGVSGDILRVHGDLADIAVKRQASTFTNARQLPKLPPQGLLW